MTEPSESFWADRHVFITGITGFMGSHLSEKLVSMGAEVYGLLRRHAVPHYPNIAHMRGKIKVIEGNLVDMPSIMNALKESEPSIVFHLAAQSYVPLSFQAPYDTYKTNIMGTANVLEAIRHYDGVEKMQFAGCYDADTRLVTTRGFKSYNEISMDDEIFSMNTNTGEIEVKKIDSIVIKNYRGKMVHFKNKRIDLLVTPDHKMLLADRRNKEKHLFFEEAIKSHERSAFMLPRGKWIGRDIEFVELDQFFDERDLHWNAIKTPERIDAQDFFYLLGAYISDGNCDAATKEYIRNMNALEYVSQRTSSGQFVKLGANRDEVSVSRSSRIFLNFPITDKNRIKLENTLERNGIGIHRYKQCVYFTSHSLYRVFKECGQEAHDKHVPRWAFEASPRLLRALLDGLLDGDGSRGKTLTTVSVKLVRDAVELGMKLGLEVTISSRQKDATFKDGRRIHSLCYDVYFSKTRRSIRKESCLEDYEGVVWCLKIPENHNFLVERNGRLAFCGNSSEEYGLVLENELPVKETNPLRPLSPYAASKVAGDYMCYTHFKCYKLPVVRTRAFNHTGPRRGLHFVTSVVARQVARGIKFKEKKLVVGNPEPKRDFSDVRDILRGYMLAVEKGKAGEVYNLGSGKSISVGELAKMAIKIGGLDGKMTVEVDKSRYRPADVMVLQCDYSKAKKELGWEPRIPFEKTLKDLIDYFLDNENLLRIEE